MTNTMMKDMELNQVNGGMNTRDGFAEDSYKRVTGAPAEGIALREQPYSGEICKLHNGDLVKVTKEMYPLYMKVFVPNLNKTGWVGSRYIR